MMDDDLAIFGGKKVREKSFSPKAFVSDESIGVVIDILRGRNLTGFIGSPVENYKVDLERDSREKTENLSASRSVTGGYYVRSFESKVASITKSNYVVSLNSATSALQAALMALNCAPGSEVILSPFSFTASCSSIVASNLTPIFCDIDLETFCLDPGKISPDVLKSANAIMAIHWNSNAGDLDGLINLCRTYECRLIEDASQAIGGRYHEMYLGTVGDAGVLSFNEPKNTTTGGEGGVVLTNSVDIAKKVRLIRNHGEALVTDEDSLVDIVNVIGYNFRLTEIQAALGLGQLDTVNELNQIRESNYQYLRCGLESLCGEYFFSQKITNSEYYPYTYGIRWSEENSGLQRDLVAFALRSEGIPVASGISRLMSDHPMFKKAIAWGADGFPFNNSKIFKKKQDLSNAQQLQESYLGFFQLGYPYDHSDMDDILRAFKKILDNKKKLVNLSINNSDVYIPGR